MPVTRSRRTTFAFAAVVAGTIGVGACSPNTPRPAPTTTATTDIADDLRPIRQAGGQATAPEMTADSSAMYATWNHYRLVGSFPDLGAPATAYMYERSDTTADEVAVLAATFGIIDAPVVLSDEFGGGWQVGPQDGSGASLYVASSSLGEWYFNQAWSAPVCADESVSNDGQNTSGSSLPGLPEPDAPASNAVPSEAERPLQATAPVPDRAVATTAVASCVTEPPRLAEPDRLSGDELTALAAGFLDDAGLGAAFEFEADENSSGYVTAYTLIDAARSPFASSFQFDEDATVMWASGNLGVAAAAGDYPLAAPAEALERFTEQRYDYGVDMGGAASKGTSTGSDDVVVDQTTTITESGGDVTAPQIDPDSSVPLDPTPAAEFEPVEVELTDVKLALIPVWDLDGVVWLLPAYEFSNADGVQLTVSAITDEYLLTAEIPAAGNPDGSGSIEPVPGDVQRDELGIIEPEPGTGRPAPDAAVAPELVGMAKDKAALQAASSGWSFRVSSIDGEDQIVTADFDENRLNVELQDGVVAAVSVG